MAFFVPPPFPRTINDYTFRVQVFTWGSKEPSSIQEYGLQLIEWCHGSEQNGPTVISTNP